LRFTLPRHCARSANTRDETGQEQKDNALDEEELRIATVMNGQRGSSGQPRQQAVSQPAWPFAFRRRLAPADRIVVDFPAFSLPPALARSTGRFDLMQTHRSKTPHTQGKKEHTDSTVYEHHHL